jgi:Na+/H+ antiporter NhaD/arsenite permease-like protein
MLDHVYTTYLILAIFIIGYIAIILESFIKIHKTAIALLVFIGCWLVYFQGSAGGPAAMHHLSAYVAEVAQIIFFLMGAMTIVEVIDSHNGFKFITDIIHSGSKRKLLWTIGFVAFFLSSVLDNLTTTILMISLLRKLVPNTSDRILFGCIVVIAANAGGAWTPIGDVTTTMLWIDERITTLAVMKAIFLPSLVSFLIPLLYFHIKMKGEVLSPVKKDLEDEERGAKAVFIIGIGALIFVPIFKALTGMPPFAGMMIGLSLLWVITDLLHRDIPGSEQLKLTSVLSRIDLSAVLFFLGILLSVNALEAAGILNSIADWLNTEIQNQSLIVTCIGLFSALIDNVPLVAATMGMYSATPTDDSLWHMIAYAAGTGGSTLIIGSAAGIALMGMEKVDFFTYLKKASLPALIGFLAGMAAYIWIIA